MVVVFVVVLVMESTAVVAALVGNADPGAWHGAPHSVRGSVHPC